MNQATNIQCMLVQLDDTQVGTAIICMTCIMHQPCKQNQQKQRYPANYIHVWYPTYLLEQWGHHASDMLQTDGNAEILAEHSHPQTSVLWYNSAEAREAILVLQNTQLSLCGENKGLLDLQLWLCAVSCAYLAMLVL